MAEREAREWRCCVSHAETVYNRNEKGTFEKDVIKQSSNRLRKGIASLESKIKEHEAKINNPSLNVPDWESYSDNRKEGLIQHWNKEIKNFQNSINNRKNELKNRGEDIE